MTPSKPATASELREGAEAIAAAQPMAHSTLASALVEALSDLTVVHAGRTATVPMKAGGNYSYDYADLGDLVKLTRPVLARHGLVALTPIYGVGDGLGCTVLVLHTSGESMTLGDFPFPHGRDAQATGSMVTYHRRYALAAALGLAVGDDDDGASAARREPEPPAKWNKGMAKAHLKNLAKGDTELAAAAWVAMDADNLPEWNADDISAAFAKYMAPADPDAEGNE